MHSLFRMWSVAVYEMKAVTRTWAFRIFVVVMALVQLFLFIMPYQSNGLGMVPSLIPLRGLNGFGFFLAWMTAAFAPELLADGRRTHVSQVIRARPVTNAEFLFGKMLGVTAVFMGLAGALSLLLWTAAAVFIGNMPAVPLPYAVYPVLLLLPMLVFLLGLALLLDTVVRSREMVTFALLTVVGVMVFALDSGRDHLFDIRGAWVPLLYSDIAGFGNIGEILLHRGMYLLLGLGFAFLAVTFFRRLSHAGWDRIAGLILALVFLTGGISLGKVYLAGVASGRDLRTEISALNERLSEAPRVTLESCSIDLVHRGREIGASAALRFTNRTAAPLDRYVFSLNPGLRVTEVTGGAGKLSFERNLHTITVTPARSLAPGDGDSLAIRYRGAINEAACYPDIPESEREMDNLHNTCAIDRRYAFITPGYVLLTREALWYPVPGTPPGPSAARGWDYDFSRYALTVRTTPGLTAISQGKAEKTDEGGFRFCPETPLPKISLIIGPYEYRKTVVDSVEYGVHVIRGHDFFSRHFRDLGPGTLAESIRSARNEIEVRVGLRYPFARFSLVEVPVQFLAHARLRSPEPETVQPEMVLCPERGMFLPNNPIRCIYSTKQINLTLNPPLTPEEIRKYALDQFIRETFLTLDTTARSQMRWRRHYTVRQGVGKSGFLSGSPYEYNMNLFPEFFSLRNGFTSETRSPFGLALGYYLESRLDHKAVSDNKHENIPDNEIAVRALKNSSLMDVLSDPQKRDSAREALYAKSVLLFTLLKAQSGVPLHQFQPVILRFLEDNRFRTVSVESFEDSLRVAFGVDVHALINRWAHSRVLPRFEISNVRYTESPVSGGSKFHLRFTLYNPEPFEGAAYMHVENGEHMRLIALNGKEAKEIHIIESEPSHILYVLPYLSQHIPDWFYVVIGPPEKAAFDPAPAGERVVSPPGAEPDSVGIIVDNLDPGFSIIPKQNLKPAEWLRERFGNPPAKLTTGFNQNFPPAQWSLAVELHFYGHTEHSAQYIRAGKGEEWVRWEADIPESGTYTVFYHNVFFFQDQRVRPQNPCVRDFHFRVSHAEGETDVEMNYHGEFPPWSPLGTFRLEKGKAWVELSDKTKGHLVYADAVKWVKRDGGKE